MLRMVGSSFVLSHPLVGCFLESSHSLAGLRSTEILAVSLLALGPLPFDKLIGAYSFIERILGDIGGLSLGLVMAGVKDLCAGK